MLTGDKASHGFCDDCDGWEPVDTDAESFSVCSAEAVFDDVRGNWISRRRWDAEQAILHKIMEMRQQQ